MNQNKLTHKLVRGLHLFVIAALLAGLALGLGPVVHAATINVVAGLVIVTADGQCSLIEAIENANDTTTGQPHTDCAAGNPGGADTIVLPTGETYTSGWVGYNLENFQSMSIS